MNKSPEFNLQVLKKMFQETMLDITLRRFNSSDNYWNRVIDLIYPLGKIEELEINCFSKDQKLSYNFLTKSHFKGALDIDSETESVIENLPYDSIELINKNENS